MDWKPCRARPKDQTQAQWYTPPGKNCRTCKKETHRQEQVWTGDHTEPDPEIKPRLSGTHHQGRTAVQSTSPNIALKTPHQKQLIKIFIHIDESFIL